MRPVPAPWSRIGPVGAADPGQDGGDLDRVGVALEHAVVPDALLVAAGLLPQLLLAQLLGREERDDPVPDRVGGAAGGALQRRPGRRPGRSGPGDSTAAHAASRPAGHPSGSHPRVCSDHHRTAREDGVEPDWDNALELIMEEETFVAFPYDDGDGHFPHPRWTGGHPRGHAHHRLRRDHPRDRELLRDERRPHDRARGPGPPGGPGQGLLERHQASFHRRAGAQPGGGGRVDGVQQGRQRG